MVFTYSVRRITKKPSRKISRETTLSYTALTVRRNANPLYPYTHNRTRSRSHELIENKNGILLINVAAAASPSLDSRGSKITEPKKFHLDEVERTWKQTPPVTTFLLGPAWTIGSAGEPHHRTSALADSRDICTLFLRREKNPYPFISNAHKRQLFSENGNKRRDTGGECAREL